MAATAATASPAGSSYGVVRRPPPVGSVARRPRRSAPHRLARRREHHQFVFLKPRVTDNRAAPLHTLPSVAAAREVVSIEALASAGALGAIGARLLGAVASLWRHATRRVMAAIVDAHTRRQMAAVVRRMRSRRARLVAPDARQGWLCIARGRHATRAALALWAAHARPLAKGARVGRVGHVRSVLRARFAMWRAAWRCKPSPPSNAHVASRVGYRLACAAWGRWRQLAFWRPRRLCRLRVARAPPARPRCCAAPDPAHAGAPADPPRRSPVATAAWLRALRAAHAEWRRRSRGSAGGRSRAGRPCGSRGRQGGHRPVARL